ncbi:general substrate transporter [Talaromyces proteolyticus]|uniref:General substrate transporter n=1 Tax=Talaromyces proteolyticus TaxID=1131652 RepID=A0AAD4L4T9_9EURO|nr:general substrate transporter [Talaromyces proteolyticus]KAH8705908.1 general substrate transporter [Talaromyces proteolyticus]
MCGFVAIMNSTTLGYDSSMMNGLQILPSYGDYFQLTTATTSLNVAIVFVGAVIATSFAGELSNRWGRRWGLVISSLIAIAGSVLQAAAVHEAMFCIGRLLIGISITVGSVAAPAYLAEIAHPANREMLVGLWGSAYYVGSIMAAAITFGSQYIDSTWAWRLPSLLQLTPSVLSIVPLAFMPESPRWLIYQDRHEEARAMIVKYHGGGDVDAPIVALEYEEICQAIAYEKETRKIEFKALLATRPNRWRFGVVAATAIFGQLSGNNIITYYLGDTLTTAGITEVQTQLGINIGINGFSLIVAVLGSVFCYRLGRHPSFLIATGVMALILIIYTILTKLYSGSDNTSASDASVFLIFFFFGAYSFVWTPLSALYPVEVLPYSLRAHGLAAYSCIVYLSAFFNVYIIPFAMSIT